MSATDDDITKLKADQAAVDADLVKLAADRAAEKQPPPPSTVPFASGSTWSGYTWIVKTK